MLFAPSSVSTLSSHSAEHCAVSYEAGFASQRAAASAVSWGAVLNAIDAVGADLCTTLRSLSNSNRLPGGMRTSTDHDAIEGTSGELELERLCRRFVRGDQAEVGVPSAFGEVLHAERDAGVNLLGVEAGRQGGVREVNGFWLLTDEQHPSDVVCLAHCVLLIGRKRPFIARRMRVIRSVPCRGRRRVRLP